VRPLQQPALTATKRPPMSNLEVVLVDVLLHRRSEGAMDQNKRLECWVTNSCCNPFAHLHGGHPAGCSGDTGAGWGKGLALRDPETACLPTEHNLLSISFPSPRTLTSSHPPHAVTPQALHLPTLLLLTIRL
jgi:hypothetical protein